MPANAFEREVDAIADPRVAAAILVDGPPSPSWRVGRENEEASNRVRLCPEGCVILFREAGQNSPDSRGLSQRIGCSDGVARHAKLAKVRPVMEVLTPTGIAQCEVPAVRKRLAPEELVIPPKRGAERVRIPTWTALGPEIEGRVDQHITQEPSQLIIQKNQSAQSG
jgi:hypothetical protein